MTLNSFILSLTVLLLIFFMRQKLTQFLNENFTFKNKIQSEWIVYILSILFIIVISMGMLLDNTKDKYADISDSFEKIRSQADTKPHRWFDINFNIFGN